MQAEKKQSCYYIQIRQHNVEICSADAKARVAGRLIACGGCEKQLFLHIHLCGLDAAEEQRQGLSSSDREELALRDVANSRAVVNHNGVIALISAKHSSIIVESES